MSFVNPLILWCLPLAIIPIVIYYLLRFRSLRVTWGANYVLERALEQLQQKLRWDQIILMTLRILAIALIVLAFARPTASGRARTVTGSGVHHVVIFDASYSMAAGRDGDRRLDRAKRALRELVGTWGRGEVWSLCVLADKPRWVVEGQPVGASEAAQSRIDEIEVVEAEASMAVALEQVAERFSAGPIELFFFADDQASTWQGSAAAALPAGLDAEAYWLRPPAASTANIAVTDAAAAIDRPLVGHPVPIRVTLRSFADRPMEEVTGELLVDGAFYERRTVALLPGQSVSLDFRVTFDEPGPHHLTAQISNDALDYDNRLPVAVEAVERLRVGVVRAPDREEKFDSAWGFFETVANAERVAEADMASAQWRLLPQPIEDGQLDELDVVFVDGASTVAPTLARQLRAFVNRGGGVVLAADGEVNQMAWNTHLDKVGLLPAQLERLHVEPVGGERFRTLSRTQLPSRDLSVFEGEDAGNLANAKFFAWWDVQTPRERVRELARLDNQQPWALAQRHELGQSVMLTAGLSGTATNLFVREFYLPLVYQLAQVAAEGADYPRTVSRGDPIRLRLESEDAVDAAMFGRYREDAEPIEPRQTRAGPAIKVERPDLPTGLYAMLTVRGEQSGTTWFAVQGERVDSDLTPLTEAQLTHLTQSLQLQRADDWPQLEQLLQAGRRGKEWYTWLVLGLTMALFAEMVVQRRFVIGPR